MEDIKNLSGNAAVDKLRELAENKICLFCTLEGNEIVSRPMGTQGIDDDGTIWFFSRRNSDKNIQITVDNKVYLMYADTSAQHYLSLTGHAQVVDDKNKIESLWTAMAKAWFEQGKDDPDITLIKVHPEEGHYWNTKNGKLVSMIKIAAAALTGKQPDAGVHGSVKYNR
jgi:general stress protein 26